MVCAWCLLHAKCNRICKVRLTSAPAAAAAAAAATAAAHTDAPRCHAVNVHNNRFFALPQHAPTQREEAREGEESHQGKCERPGAPQSMAAMLSEHVKKHRRRAGPSHRAAALLIIN